VCQDETYFVLRDSVYPQVFFCQGDGGRGSGGKAEEEFPTLSGRREVSVERPKKASPRKAVKFGE
jgi:hypothetical protein